MDRTAALALLESQHTFPSDHPFHVIVRSDETDIVAVSTALAELVGLPHLDDRTTRVPSREGRYTSLRLRLPCATAAVVLDVYAHLNTQPRVVRYF